MPFERPRLKNHPVHRKEDREESREKHKILTRFFLLNLDSSGPTSCSSIWKSSSDLLVASRFSLLGQKKDEEAKERVKIAHFYHPCKGLKPEVELIQASANDMRNNLELEEDKKSIIVAGLDCRQFGAGLKYEQQQQDVHVLWNKK